MIRRCPRNHPAPSTFSKASFTLFKPLIAIACLTIMFELLPVDFQHFLAPALVSDDDVYSALYDGELRTVSIQTFQEASCVMD